MREMWSGSVNYVFSNREGWGLLRPSLRSGEGFVLIAVDNNEYQLTVRYSTGVNLYYFPIGGTGLRFQPELLAQIIPLNDVFS